MIFKHGPFSHNQHQLPRPAERHHFTLLIQDGDQRHAIPLGSSFYSIGREVDKDIRLTSKGVSRYHANLIWLNQHYYIVDGDSEGNPSTNGLLVNGRAMKDSPLKPGDIITFCQGTYAQLISQGLTVTFRTTPHELSQKTQSNSTPSGYLQAQINLFSNFPDLMIKLDVDGYILGFQNSTDPAMARLTPQHVGQSIAEHWPADFIVKVFRASRLALQTKAIQSFESALSLGDRAVFCEVRLLPTADHQLVAIIRNITERKILEKKLLNEATQDSLTGLPNRSFFMEQVNETVALKKRRSNYQFAVLFIDLDRFKVINDSLGHLVGDQLLIEISIKLKTSLRPQDVVARLGGDEFAILLRDMTTIDRAVEVADRLQAELTKPITLDGHEIFPSASIGIAYSQVAFGTVEEMLKNADIAMYQAKAAGRSRYAVFKPDSNHDQSLNFLQLDSALKRAIERHEFVLYYQPIFELKTQRLIGAESLVRWQHPEQGLLKPDSFLAQAEETGLLIAIGEWALQEAGQQLGEWETWLDPYTSIVMSANISTRQFFDPNFVDFLAQLCDRGPFTASNFKLEVAEGTLMANIDGAIAILSQLNTLGFKVLIDHFGTGFSSLTHLHDFPIDALKIDRSFIHSMDKDTTNTGFTIIQSIVGLAHTLGLEVIAEGVECARHVAWLKTFHCDYGQGYYFGEPMPLEQITPLIKAELALWQTQMPVI